MYGVLAPRFALFSLASFLPYFIDTSIDTTVKTTHISELNEYVHGDKIASRHLSVWSMLVFGMLISSFEYQDRRRFWLPFSTFGTDLPSATKELLIRCL